MFRTSTRTLPVLIAAAVLLVAALAGTATAAKLLTGKDIKDNSITTQDIRNKGISAKDLKSGLVGKINAPAFTGYEVVTESALVGSGSQDTVFVACTAGKVAVSGGGTFEDTSVETALVSSVPQKVIRGDSNLFAPADPGFADGWALTAQHNGLDPQDLEAFVICVDPS